MLNLQKSICEFSIVELVTVMMPLLLSSPLGHIVDVIQKLLMLHKIESNTLRVHRSYEVLIQHGPFCILKHHSVESVSVQSLSVVVRGLEHFFFDIGIRVFIVLLKVLDVLVVQILHANIKRKEDVLVYRFSGQHVCSIITINLDVLEKAIQILVVH